MIKFISSEEHAKLTGDIDFWKARALEEERSKKFYKEEHGKRVSEYMALKEKYNELEKEKVTFVSFKGIKSLNEAKEMADKIIKEFNNEHHCDKNCFAEHVLPAIQRDYDSTSKKFDFISYWYEKLSKEYHWLKCLYVNGGKIYFK